MQVDVGFGDAANSGCLTMRSLPAQRVWAHPINAALAEKLEAIVSLGIRNRRMKGFYDIWFLARTFSFQAEDRCMALRATFERHKTRLDPAV